MMQVTIKTLRHYEQLGLLLPNEVDKWTGYRYYNPEQMITLSAIRDLKNVGFSLEEIKTLFHEGSKIPGIKQLESKIESCEIELNHLLGRKAQLLSMVNYQKRINTMNKFTIQKLPSIIVASHREVLKNYEAIGDMCVNVIGPEMHRLGCKCPHPGYCFTIEHDKEYKPSDVDIEYCEEVEEMLDDSEIIQFKKLPEVPTALCMKVYGPYNRFYQAYTELFQHLEKNNYRIVDNIRTNYVDGIWNQEDPEKWLSILQVPVEKA